MRTTSSIKWLIVLLLILSMTIIFLPVHWFVDKSVFTSNKLTVGSVSGYWWQRVVMHDVAIDYRGYRMRLGDVFFEYDSASLLSQYFCTKVDGTATNSEVIIQGRVCYHWADNLWSVNDASMKGTGELLAELTGLEIRGQWLADITHASLDSSYRWRHVDGEILWSNAQWYNGEQWIMLGALFSTVDTTGRQASHKSNLSADPSPSINIYTVDIDSPLAVSIRAVISHQQGISLSGYIEPYAEVSQSLSDSLQLTANRREQQRYFYDYRW